MSRHYEDSIFIAASPEKLFAYVDDHTRFSYHMSIEIKPQSRGSLGKMPTK